LTPSLGAFGASLSDWDIFTNDGDNEKNHFDRAGMAGLENFERHIGRLLALIRLNARPFGLQPLVKRLAR